MVENRVFPLDKGEEHFGLASPMDRLAAFILDCILLLPLVQLLQAPIRKQLLVALFFDDPAATIYLRLINVLIFLFVFWMYYTLSTYFWSQTIGKHFFNIKVTFLKGKPQLYLCALRSFALILQFFLAGLPFVSIFTHTWRRPIHDRISDSLVVGIKRTAGFPPWQERRAAYVFSIVFLAFFCFSSLSYFLFSEYNEQVILMVEKEGKEACEKFHSKFGDDIAKAIQSFSIKEIDSQCLRNMARDSLWSNKNKTLAYLASAFASFEDDDLARSYLDKVCEVEPDGRACLFSIWTQKSPLEDKPFKKEIKEILAGDNVEDFYKIYFIAALQSHEEYELAGEIIEQVNAPLDMTEFLSIASFRSLMWEKRWDAAYWIYKIHDIPEDDFIDYVEMAMDKKRVSNSQLKKVLEKFYPSLNIRKQKRGLASSKHTPAKIQMIWRKLEKRK